MSALAAIHTKHACAASRSAFHAAAATGTALAGKGPVLLVMDNGWASADDWVRRKEAAGALLDRARLARVEAVRKPCVVGHVPAGGKALTLDDLM